MAPSPNPIDTLRPPYSTPTTMSHSNSQTSAALNAAGRKPGASTSNVQDGIKLVTMGKDIIAIPLPAMAGINDPAYLKAASFHNLSDTAYGLLDTYNPPAVTLFVTQELPINTSLALAEASAVVGSIKATLLDVNALTPVSFIDKEWDLVDSTNPAKLADREEGLFGVKLAVNIQGHEIDSRIAKTRVFHSELVLLLPQHTFDPSDDSVTEVSSPARTSVSVNLFATPRRNTTVGAGGSAGSVSSGGSGGSGNNTSTLSPKMSNLFASGGRSGTTIKRGYYGPMTFFDSQALFNDCFGENPAMYSTVYQQSTWDTEAFNKFIGLCRFDIFMECCQLHYIGSDNVSRESYVREVCNNLAELKQVRKDSKGKEVVDTPEELFQRFVRLAANLPDDTATWTIQLPSQFLTALDSKIRNKIVISDTFTMPTPSSLKTKTDQINGTRSIKNEATTIFNDLEERKLEMKEQLALLSKNLGVRQQTRSTMVGAAYNSQSLAEGVLQEYKGPASNHPDVEIRKGADGKSYPFHIPTQFLSTFPVGFRGCYVCGSVEHWKREDCEKSKSGQFHRQTFFRNLWAHRPHTHKIKNSPNSEKVLAAGGAAQGTHLHHIVSIF